MNEGVVMPYEHLTDLLPPGAVLTDVTQPNGAKAVNVKTDRWQVAVPLSGDATQDDEQMVAQAWIQQALYEHRQRIDATIRAHRAQLTALDEQFAADVDAKVKQAKANLKAKKGIE